MSDGRRVTDRRVFRFGSDEIIVEVENSSVRFSWRMLVNGDASRWTTYYDGVLEHKGYCLATAYWDGTFAEFVPFKAIYATEEAA